MKKIHSFASLVCLAISCIGMSGCEIFDILESELSSKRNDNGLLQAPISSKKCKSKDYKAAIEEFKKAGFKNFKINFEGDLIIGFLARDGEIDSIRINENTSFDEDSLFNTKSVVFIDVHSWDEELDYVTEPVDGQLPILHLANDLDGFDKLLVGEDLEYIGFTNVKYNPIQDCASANSSKYNDTEGFKVNGSSDFNEYSFFDIDSDIKISYHTVEGDYCTNGLEHTCVDSPVVEPTCTEPGWTSETRCSVCGKHVSGHTEIPPKGHTAVIDKPGYPATCISTGISDETHCSECNAKLSGQEILPIDPNNHVNVEVFAGEKPTCVSTGTSDKIVCHDCETVVSEHEPLPIDPNNHKNIITTEETRPSNGKDGRTASSQCKDCNTVIQQSTAIPWSGSAEEKAATSVLESVFPKETAKKAVLTAMCNYFSPDTLDSSGNYVVASKLHNYSYASTKYRITSSGTWKWAGEKKWRFEGFTLYGYDWQQYYPLYGYISVDSTKYHLTGVNNGKANTSQYITYSEETCFNFSISLV